MKNALQSALRSAGANVRQVNDDAAPITPAPAPKRKFPPQPSRQSTKPITVHHPTEVHRQIKTLAAEQGRKMEDVIAEAFNLLFAKHRKPEIAPRKSQQVD